MSAFPSVPPSTSDVDALISKFRHQSILSITQFSRRDLLTLMSIAGEMAAVVRTRGCCSLLQDKVMASIFYEPSTRTSCSFQAAMLRLGGKVLPVPDVLNSSSVSKGETIADTMRCLQCYVDAIVMRHPQPGSVKLAADSVSIPLINAGDGIGEHPTQALLDLYCIQQEAGRHDGLVVTMMGDLKHGRTVHSLAKLLTAFTDIELQYVSPPSLSMPQDVHDFVATASSPPCKQSSHPALTAALLSRTDILYVTRVQKERFSEPAEYAAASASYSLTPGLLSELGGGKDRLRILHPLPRVNEIHDSLDSDARSAYFRQMRYGLYVRMALLSVVFGRRLDDEQTVAAAAAGRPTG